MTPDEAVAVLRNYTDWVAIDVDFFDDALDVVASLARDHAALLDWAERAETFITAGDCQCAPMASPPHVCWRCALLAEWDEMRERPS